jgi:hypothetical protein
MPLADGTHRSSRGSRVKRVDVARVEGRRTRLNFKGRNQSGIVPPSKGERMNKAFYLNRDGDGLSASPNISGNI